MARVVTEPGGCAPYQLAILLARLLPRGKGAIPRLIGRIAAPWINHSLITRHGARLPILPGALDVFVSMAEQESSWDYWVLRAIERVLGKDGVLYDVGANVGYLSVEFAHNRREKGGVVYAFEPNGELATGIRRAVELNHLDNLQVMEVAVGDAPGEVEFALMPHSIHSSAVTGIEGAKAVIRVRQESIDHLVDSGSIRPPGLIKIDVEGYEFAVLQGARETIGRHRPYVIFEVSDHTDKTIASLDEFVRFFDGVGGYRICNLRGEPVDLKGLELARGTHKDFMAVPDSSALKAEAM